MTSEKSIGIIANPASGKDIRRMVSYAVSVDNTDKVRIVQQIILAACSMGVNKIYYMPEYYGIFVNAIKQISYTQKHIIEDLDIVATHKMAIGNQEDTITAASVMEEAKVGCILTLGGDGTNRVVAKYSGDIPLIPISTGTNNVFPITIQGTTAGTAAGLYVMNYLNQKDKFVKDSKQIEIWRDNELLDIALIDAVIIDEIKTESRALWDTDSFNQVFLTSCKLESIGISSMGAMLKEIKTDSPEAMFISYEDEINEFIHFPVAPGLYISSGISSWKTLEMEEKVAVSTIPCVIAVDGEKDIYIRPGSDLEVKITWNGPKLLNTDVILKEAAKNNMFHNQLSEFDPNYLEEIVTVN